MVNKHGARVRHERERTPAVCAPESSSPTKPRPYGPSGRGSSSSVSVPYFYGTCSYVCEREPVQIAAGWFRSPALGLRIFCHVVPSTCLQLSPPTLLTRAPLSFSGLWLLKSERDIHPSPPPLVERLKDRTPIVESANPPSPPVHDQSPD